jgi:hypothetical protein
MASSGYDWKADAEVLLDTAVIGAPGSVLPLPRSGQPPLPEAWIAHRQALARWYRAAAPDGNRSGSTPTGVRSGRNLPCDASGGPNE